MSDTQPNGRCLCLIQWEFGKHMCQPEDAGERVTRLCRLLTFDRADLLGGELASASTAAPARRCKMRDYSHRRLIGAPSSHQFATAVGTLSLNH